jgi:hypothetical protein
MLLIDRTLLHMYTPLIPNIVQIHALHRLRIQHAQTAQTPRQMQQYKSSVLTAFFGLLAFPLPNASPCTRSRLGP